LAAGRVLAKPLVDEIGSVYLKQLHSHYDEKHSRQLFDTLQKLSYGSWTHGL